MRHHVRSALRLGERDDVADRAALRHEHDEAIETESDAAVRRCAVLEGVHHEAELLTRLFLREPDGLEDFLLQISLIDAQAAAADLDAVQNHVVSVRLDPSGVGHQVLDIFAARRRERMVHGLPALLFLVVFKHREVRDPEEFQRIGIDEAAAARHLKAQFAERLCDDERLVRDDEQEIARLGMAGLLDLLEDFIGVELLVRRLHALFRVLNPRETLRAVALHILHETVQLAARDIRIVLDIDDLDLSAVFEDRGEDLEVRPLDVLRDVHELHAEAKIGLIRAEPLHRLVPLHAQKRRFELDAERLVEKLRDEALHQL